MNVHKQAAENVSLWCLNASFGRINDGRKMATPEQNFETLTTFSVHYTTSNTVVWTKWVYLRKAAENQPEAYVARGIHTCIRNWYTIYSPNVQPIPYTFKNRYTSLTCKLHQIGINGDGQLPTKTLLLLYRDQKKPARKNPLGKKWQEICVRQSWKRWKRWKTGR